MKLKFLKHRFWRWFLLRTPRGVEIGWQDRTAPITATSRFALVETTERGPKTIPTMVYNEAEFLKVYTEK